MEQKGYPLTFTLHEPATVADLAEVVGRATHAQMGMYRAQMAAGMSFAVRGGLGEACCVGGFVPLDSGEVEAWFAVVPDASLVVLRAVIRAIALTLTRSGYPEIVVVAGTPAGAQIARMAGFQPIAVSGDTHEGNHRLVWRRQGQGRGTGGARGGSFATALARPDGEGQRHG